MTETPKLDPAIRDVADIFAFTIGRGMMPLHDTKAVCWERHLKEAARMALRTRQTLLEKTGQRLDFVTVYLSVTSAGRIDSFGCTFDFLERDGEWIAQPRSEDVRAFRDLDRRLKRFLN